MAKARRENIGIDVLINENKTTRRKSALARNKKDRSIRAVFRALLKTLDIEKLKQPWMATKSFRLLTTEEQLVDWVDTLLKDPSRWHQPYADKDEWMPVVAVDTETFGLDTRVLVHIEQGRDAQGNETWTPVFEVKAEIAGICLSYDGVGGVYIPIMHEDGKNIPRAVIKRELQRLFDVSHLVFYNAKFDREVLRTTCAIEFLDYPYYEDVQALHYNNDPKAKLDEGKFSGDSGGLKRLSEDDLKLKQIDLASIGKVKAEWCPITGDGFCQCSDDDKKRIKHRMLVQYVPFSWIPTEIALWYAAADGICTWLLWKKYHAEAQSRRRVHRIDGELIDTLTWIERQRPLIDTEPLERMKKWHLRAMEERREHLRQLAIKHGWEDKYTEDGVLIESSRFSVDSPKCLSKLLFEKKEMTIVKRSKKTNDPSCDADALVDLTKLYPNDEFLKALIDYREYVALHPENFRYDPVDHTARLYFKQCTVAGGRLAAAGGQFEKDGGFGLNPQAIKRVEKGKSWFVKGRILTPDFIDPEEVEEFSISALDASCFRAVDEKKEKLYDENNEVIGAEVSPEAYRSAAIKRGWVEREDKKGKLAWYKLAPGIIKNHILNALGYSICLVKDCTRCEHHHGVLIEDGKLDANQCINFRKLFISENGWSFFTSDYSNIEMRVASNESREPKFIREFLEGSGDFHTLTAINIFPEYSDPNTPSSRKKELRSIAKIINFALLYGSKGYSVYENLKKSIPTITFKECMEMIEKYWAGLPEFKRFCDRMQKIAREQMICETATGRIIKFNSQMKALGIHKPEDIEMDNFFAYKRVEKAMKKAEEDKDTKLYERLKEQKEAIYKNKDNGVRNAIDYQKFMSKIERVSVNIPLQGLAGDIMRMALNRIRKYATLKNPDFQSIFRLPSSVHDELDYSVRNRYEPYVVPRVTRMMKLRRLHEKKKWPVPIECDTEYERSWDVEHHMTGDEGHKPAAYTEIPGLESYLPEEFTPETFERLVRAIMSPRDEVRDRAWSWLEMNLHKRAFSAAWYAFWTLNADKQKERLTSEQAVRKQLTAALQLHEFWLIDEVPDHEEDTLETLEQYEQRCGLTPNDRGFMPPGGYLAAIPLEGVRRPVVPVLGPEPEPEDPLRDLPLLVAIAQAEAAPWTEVEAIEEVIEDQYHCIERAEMVIDTAYDEAEARVEDAYKQIEEAQQHITAAVVKLAEIPPETLSAVTQPQAEPVTPSVAETINVRVAEAPCSLTPELEDEMFQPAPRKRRPVAEANQMVVAPLTPVSPVACSPTLPELRDDMDEDLWEALRKELGYGDKKFEVLYLGQPFPFERKSSTEIPTQFLKGAVQ